MIDCMIEKKQRMSVLYLLFLTLTMMPFIIPNPIITTNIQPYSALLGTLILLGEVVQYPKIIVSQRNFYPITAFLTLLIAIFIMFVWGINISSFRAVYNYYAVAIVPCATMVVLSKLNGFPEKELKALILVWFFVCSVQFFVNRGFLTFIISGVRFSYSYRGVVGLASEPSFLGITCFYFLHMVRKFKTQKLLFSILVLVMGVLYAQSVMGLLFIVAYMLIFLLENTNTLKGIVIWAISLIGGIVFVVLANEFLQGSRMYQLIKVFLDGGLKAMLADQSATVRVNAIFNSIQDALDNYFLPMGYARRIGSGYGGFLCELGFFALPIISSISFAMACSFRKPHCKVLYFFVFTFLMLNNTQVGNPLLLFVVGTNLYYRFTEDKRLPNVP